MASNKNITLEERELAISTIEKVGEQITEERIEYYVQLRRNTVKYQKEKLIREELDKEIEQNKEFAKKVLSYMKRSRSDRQIFVYARKHAETLIFIKENNIAVEYTPSIFGEAIFFLERLKTTTIHHLTAEDLAICIKDKKIDFLNAINQKEAEKKERTSKEKKNKVANEGGKAIRLSKIALWLGVALIMFPFFITGFGFGWFWYITIIGIAICTIMLLGIDGKSEGEYSLVKSILLGYCAVGLIMYLWGPLNPNYDNSVGRSSSFGNYKDSPKTQWTCVACNKTFTYYKDEIGEHDKWDYWSGQKICHNCYGFRKSVNDVLKSKNSKYANYNN